MEECESLDAEMTELQEFQCESPDAVGPDVRDDLDAEDEVEELRNSLREVVQDPSVKPKLQCLMVDPSFSMVTVQSEDSGIVWETASSRCSTPWASEASSPSEVYSNEGSGAQGKITIVFDEEKVVRRRTRAGGRSRLGDRLSRPGSSRSRSGSALGVERPEMAEVSVPNIKSDATEADADLELLKDKDQQLFSLISEGYEILNIRVPSKLPTVDEEESTELPDNLSYLNETPGIKSQLSRAASQCESQAVHTFPGIVDVEAFEQDDGEEASAMSPKTSPDTEKKDLRNRKDATSDMDYFEHFTLVDGFSASPAEEVEEPEEQEGRTPAPKPQAEDKQGSGPAAASHAPSGLDDDDDSFEFVADVEMAGDHLDEVFYGRALQEDAGAAATPDDQENSRRGRRESGRSQKGSGSALFSTEETTLTPIFLSPGPPKIIDPILLEEPTAMSFLYADLYEDAMGERRRSDEEGSEAGSVMSERSCARRPSIPEDEEETHGYLEKFTLKDETPAAERPSDSEEGGGEEPTMWSQNKFEMTGCLIRVEEEEEPKTEEASADAGVEAGPIVEGPVGAGEDPQPQKEEILGEEEIMREVEERSESAPSDCALLAQIEQKETAQGKEQLDAEPAEQKDAGIMDQTDSGALQLDSDKEASPPQNVTSGRDTEPQSEIQATKGQEEADCNQGCSSVGAMEEVLTEVEGPKSLEAPQGVSDHEKPAAQSEAQAPAAEEELVEDTPEVEVTDTEEKAVAKAETEAVEQSSEKVQEVTVSTAEAHSVAVEPETATQEDEASVGAGSLEEPRENREVVEMVSPGAMTPGEVSEPAAEAEVAAEQEGAVEIEAAILDTTEQAGELLGEPMPYSEREVDKMEEVKIAVEPEQPVTGGESANTEASVEGTTEALSEGLVGDVESLPVKAGVAVATQEEVPVAVPDEVKGEVNIAQEEAPPVVTENAAEEAESPVLPSESVPEVEEEEVSTAGEPGAAVGSVAQEESQGEAVTGEEQAAEVLVTPDIVAEKQEPVVADEPATNDNISAEAPLNKPEVKTEVISEEEGLVVVEEAAIEQVDVLPEPPSQAVDTAPERALVDLELLTVVLKGIGPVDVVDTPAEAREMGRVEEELLPPPPETEAVEIQTQAGVGQEKEEVQEAVREEEVLPLAPQSEAAETQIQAGAIQDEAQETVREEEVLPLAPQSETVKIQLQTGIGQEKEEVQEIVREEEVLSLAPQIEAVETELQTAAGQEKEEVQESVTEENMLSLTPQSEAVESKIQTEAGQEKEEVQETVREEEVLSLAPQSEGVETELQTGPGQDREELQETVREEEVVLPLTPQNQTVETKIQAGAGQETKEVHKEKEAIALSDTLTPLPLAPTEVEGVPPTEGSEWWPSPPAPLDVEEAQEIMEELEAPEEEVDFPGGPGGLSSLRSFPPLEDLSGVHREDEELPHVFEETAEELGYEMISAEEVSAPPTDGGGKNDGEPRRPGLERREEVSMEEEDVLGPPSRDGEPVEEGYDIIDAEEESEAREAAELQGMDWFCVACDALLSEGDLGEHEGHQVTAVDQAHEDVKERLSEWISELQQRSENIEDLVSELELAYNSVEDHHRDSETAMRAQNEEVMALLMEQYNSMSVGTEEEKKAKLEQLYDQIVSFQESIDAAKGTLETTTREAETDARSPAEIQTSLSTALETAMALELGPQGLLVFEDYAKGHTSSTQTHRKGIPVPQKPSLQPQEKDSATSTSVTVYWNVNPGDIIDCFQVYCMEDPQGAVSEEYRVTVKESYCVLEELDPDKTYKVWVMAVNYTGCSLPSERQSFRTAPMVPAIDTERCSILWDSATLRWSPASHTAAQSYTLEYCRQYALEGEGLRSISGIRGTEQKVLLQPNENYLFYIKAVNEAGASEQSEAALISTKGTRFHLLKASAHPALELSQDMSTVHYSQDTYDQTQDPDSLYPSVVGEALPPQGRHYWETDVTRCTAYRVGVALGTANRNSPLGESSGSWCLHCVPTASSCRFELLNASVQSDVFVVEVPERVGVLLDYKHDSLSFYNAKSGQRLGTLCHRFTQPCHPALGMEQPGSLEVSMVLEVPEFAKHS